jgi:hypothetical protein
VNSPTVTCMSDGTRRSEFIRASLADRNTWSNFDAMMATTMVSSAAVSRAPAPPFERGMLLESRRPRKSQSPRRGSEASRSTSHRTRVPWSEASVIRQATADLVFSHSVLGHVVNLEDTYHACAQWLKPGGWMLTRLVSPRITWRKYGMTTGPTRTGYGRASWASVPFISIGNRAPTISNCYAPVDLRSYAT